MTGTAALSHLDAFDLDNPDLANEIRENALSSGGYPYTKKLKRSCYEEMLRELQIELVKLQTHNRNTGKRVVVVFEGRDAAGKGGTIFAIKRNQNPRHTRAIALSKPTDIERGQWYFQRYVNHLPTAGEMVLFDRSWYNRAGVEPVMGFCTEHEHEKFLAEAPNFERMIIDAGLSLFKIWLNVGREMQMKRFHDRRHDPLKRWKLSPIDLKALQKWDEYTDARNEMMDSTHTDHAPWTVVRSNDKRRARLNAIRHVLKSLDYDGKDEDVIGEIDSNILTQGPAFFRAGKE